MTKLSTLIAGSFLSILLVLSCLCAAPAQAAITSITPLTWNIIGLDSNTPSMGPNRFPVGARVYSNSATEVTQRVYFHWETDPKSDANAAYIYLKDEVNKYVDITIPANGHADAYFEVLVDPTSASFGKSRRYYIQADTITSPRPRELYVEHLVSQGRNAITNLEYRSYPGGTWKPIGPGADFSLVEGRTYEIRLSCYTATQGYEQLESFSTLPFTIFQLLSVTTTYTADTSPNVDLISDKLYADGCTWDNDPDSPNYLACYGDGKAGGTMTITYRVTIIDIGDGSEALMSLIHDFSGSSYHYNSDYLSGGRTMNFADPAQVGISKSFSPSTIMDTGISTMTITLTNPNAGEVDEILITDDFTAATVPVGGALRVNEVPVVSNSCGGTVTDFAGGALAAGGTGIKVTGAKVPGYGSCSIVVKVDVNNTQGAYINSAARTINGTSLSASAILTVDNNANPTPTPPSSCPGSEVTLAAWTFDNLTAGSAMPGSPNYSGSNPNNSGILASGVSSAVASYFAGTGSNTISAGTGLGTPATNSWAGNGFNNSSGGIPTYSNTHFKFTVDTSNYNGIFLELYPKVEGGTWAAGNKLKIYRNGTAFATEPTLATSYPATPVTTTSSSTVAASTEFAVQAYYRSNSKPSAYLYLDNVAVKGCAAPIPPTISKAFSAATVGTGEDVTLTFSIYNPNLTPAVTLTGVKFYDDFPAGLIISSPNGLTPSPSCGSPTITATAGTSSITFSDGTIASGATCTVDVKVKANTAGTYNNVSSKVSADSSGASSGSASATLTAIAPPTIDKSFSPNSFESSISSPGSSTLTFTIVNPNAGQAISGVTFTDPFPTGLTITNISGPISACGVTLLDKDGNPLGNGDSGVKLVDGTIAAGGTCTFSVDVTSTVDGFYTNTTTAVTHLVGGSPTGTDTASDTLQVIVYTPAISLRKQVSLSANGPWISEPSYLVVEATDKVYYRFIVENTGDRLLDNVYVVEDAPGTVVDLTSCDWEDGTGAPLNGAAPFTLPTFTANDAHIAYCVLGEYETLDTLGDHDNQATAYGTHTASSTTVSSTSTATYTVSALDLSKSTATTSFTAAGTVITYSYTVKNNGLSDLQGPVTITDNKITSISCPNLDSPTEWLNAGLSTTCTASYTTTQVDFDNDGVTNIARAKLNNIFSPTAIVTVPVLVDLTAAKSNDVGGVAPESTFTWTLTVANSATWGNAHFLDNEVILRDQLPNSGASYGTPVVTSPDVIGTIACVIDGTTKELTCTANGHVKIPKGKSFTVAVPVNIASIGTLFNPRKISSSPDVFGICKVDPNALRVENDETNNSCSDNVVIGQPLVTILKSADKSATGAAPGDEILYTIQLENTGNGVGKTVVLRDDVSPYTQLKLDYDDAGPLTTAFSFTDTTAAPGTSGLSIVKTEYSTDNGATWVDWSVTPPPDGDADGYNGDITNWKLTLTSPTDKFKLGGKAQLTYKMKVE